MLREMSGAGVDAGSGSWAYYTQRRTEVAQQILDLNVEGMSCQHCVHAVKSSVSALAGVAKVDVSLEKKLVTVGFDPGLTSIEVIKHAIEDQGYTVP
jgi:copper chaperone